MKTIILNDTRSAEHAGCELVMRNTLAECRRVGIKVAELWKTSECQNPLVERLQPDAFDSLLINGEGSMHDDRPVAAHLCEAARWAKGLGKKVILFNTLWESNTALNRHLEVFDRIYCRDSASRAAIQEVGVACDLVPDMIFATNLWEKPLPEDSSRNELTVIDSIDRKKSERLSKFAAYHGFPFLHMDRIGFERLKKRLFVRTGWYSVEEDFVDCFVTTLRSSHRFSGRFHGTCLAMALGVPVVSVSSNTRKLENLHRDVGLSESLVLSRVPKRMEELDASFETLKTEMPQLSAYVGQAPEAIRRMFEEIAAVFRG